MSKLTPTLSETIEGVTKKQPLTPKKIEAFFHAAEIAMKAVMRAGQSGNVQCKQAIIEMAPYLAILTHEE